MTSTDLTNRLTEIISEIESLEVILNLGNFTKDEIKGGIKMAILSLKGVQKLLTK